LFGYLDYVPYTDFLKEKLYAGEIDQETFDTAAKLAKTADKDNELTAAVENLRVGEYLVHESFASVHGYTWDGVTYTMPNSSVNTEVYNGITSAVVEVTTHGQVIALNLTNDYTEWTEADFYIHKENPAGEKLAGAEFTLYSDEALSTAVDTKTTAADGYAHFSGFTVPAGETVVTYYLKETKAPAGYYLDETLYKVEVKAVTNAVTTYEAKISLQDGNGGWVEAGSFDKHTDLLTVVNKPITGTLTLTKHIHVNVAGQNIPTGLAQVIINVAGPGYNEDIELNAGNGWTKTLENLPLGTYTITEQDASVPGYELTTDYTAQTVTLSEANVGQTKEGTVISGASEITNTYVRNEETFEKPTKLIVKKTDEQGNALAGAVFSLVRDRDNYTVTYTTNSSGIVEFDELSGTVNSGKAEDGIYTLKEVSAPAGYAAAENEWKVTVAEDDGQPGIYVLNTANNTFENFWQWIVENVSGTSVFDQQGSVLNVVNHKVLGELTVSKVQTGESGGFRNEITVNVSGPDGFSKAVKLNEGNNWTAKLTD
ncbi:MAG: hypothetical protein IIV43_02435, partial [Oscillospiraceae bacterium]|nr:hypothetical protein [Oscillospiraceae bacterium]